MMRRWLFTGVISLTLALPVVLYAADPCAGVTAGTSGNFVPLACYKNTALDSLYTSNPSDPNALGTYVSNLFKIALSAGAILAVIRLVWAGYNYMGSDMWSTKQQARDIIKDVVWGMLLLLGTYLILYQINPEILNLNMLRSFQSPLNPPT